MKRHFPCNASIVLQFYGQVSDMFDQVAAAIGLVACTHGELADGISVLNSDEHGQHFILILLSNSMRLGTDIGPDYDVNSGKMWFQGGTVSSTVYLAGAESCYSSISRA